MANITISPQGQIKLCQVPLVNDYKNQLTFASASAQLTYFNSKVKKTYSNYTYIKKDNVIKVNETVDNIINCNYLFYTNVGFTTKTYFCFITNMRYVNENCTEITFETDVFQTWFFELLYKPCFVEREHVNDDTIGANTLDENLNVGEIIEEAESEDLSYGSYKWVGVLTSHDPITGKKFPAPITVYNGNIMSKKLCLFEASDYSNLVNLGIFLLKTTRDDKDKDIESIFFIPDVLIDRASLILHSGTVLQQNLEFYTLPNNFNIKTFNTTIAKQLSFSDYTPKNR